MNNKTWAMVESKQDLEAGLLGRRCWAAGLPGGPTGWSVGAGSRATGGVPPGCARTL